MSDPSPATRDEVDAHLDAVLRASGSALGNYVMSKTIEAMRAAMRNAMQTTPSEIAQKPVAWQAKHPGEIYEWFQTTKEVCEGRLHGAYEYRELYAAPVSAPSATREISLAGYAPKLYGTSGATGTLGPFGLTVRVDPNMPEDTLEFRDGTGRVLGKIINVGRE